MRTLLFVMTLFICGCAGGRQVVPTKSSPFRNYNITPTHQDSKETTPSNYWIVLWLGSVSLASLATYRTFKKK